jgi:nucleoside-diphosphate-sugar epimerase
MKNKHGRIVSRRKHASGKRSIKHLEKLGYKATTTLEQGIPKFVDWFLKYYKHNEKN